MNKKKVGLFFLLTFVALSFFTSFVSGQPTGSGSVGGSSIIEDVTRGIDETIIKPLQPVLQVIIGETPDGQYLIIKLLVLIVVFAVAYAAARKTPTIGENGYISFFIALIVALLATRYLTSEELVQFVWLPSGVFGVVIMALLPFVLFFFLIESLNSTTIRKVGWITFGVVYFALSIYRWNGLRVGPGWWNNLGWWYIIIGVLSILAVYFDRKLRARYVLASLGKETTKKNMVSAARLIEAIDDQIKVRDTAIKMGNTADRDAAEKEIERLNHEVARLK